MDVIVGEARIYAVGIGKTQGWVIHGGRVLFDRDQAVTYARKVDKLLRDYKP